MRTIFDRANGIIRDLLKVAGIIALLLASGAQASTDALFDAVLTDTQDAPMPLSSFRGKPLIVNFWARWCAPCREELPELTKLQAQYAKQGMTVLGIALESNAAKVREFLAAHGVKYPVALIREGDGIALMQALDNTEVVLPFTLLIDRQGNVVLKKRGVFKKSDFLSASEKLLR